jgi:hypothetical protein
MDSTLLIAAGASFIAGLLGYIIAILWIRPIVRYHITKRRLDHELTRFLEQINAPTGSEKLADKTLGIARTHAMDLFSCYGASIPYWYRLLLDSRNESPAEASGLLTNLSRIGDIELVKKRIDRARKAMRLR